MQKQSISLAKKCTENATALLVWHNGLGRLVVYLPKYEKGVVNSDPDKSCQVVVAGRQCGRGSGRILLNCCFWALWTSQPVFVATTRATGVTHHHIKVIVISLDVPSTDWSGPHDRLWWLSSSNLQQTLGAQGFQHLLVKMWGQCGYYQDYLNATVNCGSSCEISAGLSPDILLLYVIHHFLLTRNVCPHSLWYANVTEQDDCHLREGREKKESDFTVSYLHYIDIKGDKA